MQMPNRDAARSSNGYETTADTLQRSLTWCFVLFGLNGHDTDTLSAAMRGFG